MIGAALSLALAWALGVLAVQVCWPTGPACGGHRALKVWLGLGCGLGLVSFLQFFSLLLVGYPSRGAIAGELVLGAFLFVLYRRGQGNSALQKEHASEPATPGMRAVRLLGLVVIGAVVLRLIYLLGLNPHGSWDAFAIWNVRARFLYRLSEAWPTAFDAHIAHADYPLLVPGIVLRGWLYAGREHAFVPMSVAVGYAGATIGLLHSALGGFRSSTQAWLGVLVLVGTPFFVTHSASQTADVPLAFYVLATATLLLMHDGAQALRPRVLLLAGLMAGCAAWTKNEGLLFVLAFGTARFAVLLHRRGLRGAVGELGWCALGLLPACVALVYFKLRLAPPNDLVTVDAVRGALQHVSTPARYGELLRALGAHTFNVQTSVFTALPLLVGYVAVAGRAKLGSDRIGVYTVMLVLGGVLVGYLLVYLAFSHNIAAHVQTSFDRLMLHLWPTAVLTYFLFVRTPGTRSEA